MARILTLVVGLAMTSLCWAGPGDIHYVKTLQAQIHAKPSAESEITLVVAIGRKLVEIGREDSWIYVGVDKTGGKDGWIRASQVSDKDPDGLRY